MVRALILLALALALVATVAGSAHARRQQCEPDELVSELRMTLGPPVVTVEAELPPVPRLPIDSDVCLPGVGGDAGCRPHEPLPGPSGVAFVLSADAYVPVQAPSLPPAAPASLARARARAAALADGHRRRVERPPRSV